METVVNKVLSFKQFINEGVNDPSIFKAIFLAGGPGSGKSFIVGRTALTSLGFKVINSDIAFENALKKVGLKPTPEDIYSPKGQEVRGQAKALTTKMMQLAIDGRLGLVIDGTGKDYEKIETAFDCFKKFRQWDNIVFGVDVFKILHKRGNIIVTPSETYEKVLTAMNEKMFEGSRQDKIDIKNKMKDDDYMEHQCYRMAVSEYFTKLINRG